VKHLRCFSQSLSALRLGGQTADTDCDWLKQLNRFGAVLAFCFRRNKTVSFLFYLNCADSFRSPNFFLRFFASCRCFFIFCGYWGYAVLRSLLKWEKLFPFRLFLSLMGHIWYLWMHS